jgi:hypothetical protein
MSKMKFSSYQAKQSRIVEGVCVADCDYDELLREAVRVALRKEMNPACDDWYDLDERIRRLMNAYIASPEGEGEDTCTLMTRLAASVAENLIRFDLMTESLSVGRDDRADYPPLEPGRLAHSHSSADCIITTCESEFSVHTGLAGWCGFARLGRG